MRNISRIGKRKVVTNLPTELLEEATELSGLAQTAAIIEGLTELVKREKRKRFLALEGEMIVDYPAEKVRGRTKP